MNYDDTLIARSSGESELHALADTVSMAQHQSYVADEQGTPFPMPMTIYTDSTAAMGYVNNHRTGSRLKSVDVRRGEIARLFNRDLVKIKFIKGTENPADGLTKILKPAAHQAWEKMVMVLMD